MARTKKSKTVEMLEDVAKEYDGPLSKYEVIKEVEYTDENGIDSVGKLEVGSITEMPTILGDSLVADGYLKLHVEEEKEELNPGVINVFASREPLLEVEMYNGKKVIGKGEVEIHGVKHKTITTEEGSTYTL